MNPRKLLSRRMITLAAVALLLTALACSFPGLGGKATEEPVAETEAPSGPTRIPTVDVSLLPPTTPRLVAQRPDSGEELPLDGSIDLYFDQPMDRGSVEDAIRLDPVLDVELLWVDDSTLRIIPRAGELERATNYEVLVGKDATSVDGLPLEDPVTVDVQTVGFLEVGEVVPAPDAQSVETGSVITAFFNRPVVPLVIAEDMPGLPQPLSFEPDIPGQGEWVNTSIYMWKPSQALAGGTTYTVTVGAGLADQTGGVLQEAYSWQFTTLPPDVVGIDPTDGQAGVPLDASVAVTFNQPMDHTSTQNAFALVEQNSGQQASGSFAWDDDSRVLTFTPSGLLALGGNYLASVADSARGASGNTGLVRAYDWTFQTVPAPAVVRTEPANGSQSVSVWRGIEIYFASPMDEDSVEKRLVVEPELPDTATIYTGSGYGTDSGYWRLSINTVLEASTTYTVTLKPGAFDPYGNTISQPYTFSFTTAPLDPLVQFNTQGAFGLYDANRPTELFAVYRNISSMDLTLFSLTLEQFGRITTNVVPFYDYTPPSDQILRHWRVTSEAALNEAAYARLQVTQEEDGSLEPGFYLLIADAPEIDGDLRHIMVVTNANLTYKVSFDETLAWLTDFETGQPLSGVPVRFYDPDFNRVADGVTGPDGIVEVDTPHQDALWQNFYAIADGGGVFAVALTEWSDGIQPWDFSLPSQYEYQAFSLYLYTDRPIYRPGQEVFFKGVLRGKDDVTYTIPDRSTVAVEIYNDQGDQIDTQTLPLSEMGTFDGSLVIGEDATLGYYSIEVSVGDFITRVGFQVAEYRKPEFVVNVEPEQDAVLVGDTIVVNVEAEFFFGGPVSDADISWTALSAPHYFNYTGPGRYSFIDYSFAFDYESDYIPGFGEVIADGVGRTDKDGRFVIRLPASLDQESSSRQFTIEAVVTDVNERSVAGRAGVVVHKGEYYVGVHSDTYIGQAGEEQSASLAVVDWDSQPVADQEVVVQPVEVRWNSVKEEDEYGRTQWVWTTKETPIGDPITVTTDAKGLARVAFTPPEGGTVKIRATVTDTVGNKNVASDYVWISSRDFIAWRQTNDNRFDLVADKDSYKPGETAELLIASPFAGSDVKALVTIERGSILSYEVITLRTNSTVYKVPISGDLAPNVYVSVVIVKGVDGTNPVPAFKMGAVTLTVDPVEQTLQVKVIPDRERVGPREEVTYRVETKDFKGNAVDAEVSLALVDLATLSLASPNSGPIVDHFYGSQGLGVRTSVPLIYLVDRLNQELFDKGKGGGGGGGEGFFDIRTEFEDTAYWSARVRTGEDGVATVSLTLPDNLTTWRMDARAVNGDTLVGQDEVDIVATKPLLIRPVTPRFFIIGDEATLSAVVNNNTEEAVDAVVTLQAKGVQITGTETHEVNIAAGGRVEVKWPVVVDANAEWVDLVFGVRAGELSDASRPPLGDPANDQQLPVYRYEVPETVGTAGQLTQAGERVEGIVLPPTYEVTQGNVTVQLNPSLAAATLDGLRWLEHQPYECTEQVVSRFLPNAFTLRTLREFGLSDEDLEKNLNEQVNVGLQKLYAQQHVDGGWGWFVSGDSEPVVTAYVVQGLLAVQEAGIQVDRQVVDNGVAFLTRQLVSLDALDTHWKLDRQAYILYVLALADSPDVSRTVQLYEERESLQHWARALLAQTMWLIDPTDTRLENIKSDLVNAAILSATGAHWKEAQGDPWNWNTDTRTTAIILATFSRVWPDNELVPNVVRWLMVARQGDHWETTQETVWALLGLTDWMATTGELDADYAWEFTFNGVLLASGKANSATVSKTRTITIDVADLLPDNVNRLTFSRESGPGRLYYTAHLTAFLPVEEVDPLSRGVVVSRRYLDKNGKAVTQGRVGDILTVEVTIVAPRRLHYVVVEDYYPAGAEAIDVSLLTESVVGQRPTLRPDDPLQRGWGWWWFSETDLRDEKAVLYADTLAPGTYQFTYQIRLGLEGEFRVIPPVGWEFYFPEVYGRGEGMLFTILPEQ